PVAAPPARVDAVRSSMPELPTARRMRLVSAYGLPMKDAVTLTQAVPGLDDYFEETVAAGADLKLAKNWLLGHVLARMNDDRRPDAGAPRRRPPPPHTGR